MKKNLTSYLITDPKHYTNDKKKFINILSNSFKKHRVNMACFRDKISLNKTSLAKSFVRCCKKHNIENLLINSDYKLALKFGANGVHLNSTQFDKIKKARKKGLFVIISCHTLKEIKKAVKLKANAITLSPIFYTPNKGNPKGVKILKKAVKKYKIDIFALGGVVTKKHLKKIEKTRAKGFASIRYFV